MIIFRAFVQIEEYDTETKDAYIIDDNPLWMILEAPSLKLLYERIEDLKKLYADFCIERFISQTNIKRRMEEEHKDAK